MPQRLSHQAARDLAGRKLIILSNREPYIHKRSGAGVKVDRPAGGLTSALDDVLNVTGGTWVAWGSGSADRDSVDLDDRVAVPPEQPAYTLKRVWLTVSEVENYYHGYANQVLWPLCHIALDRVYFRKRFWEDYVRANRSFADAALAEATDDALVWVHDYHLCLAPRYLRERRPGLTIAHFWHIPWPDWSVYRVCPQARELLEGLLGNDLIGFQIPLFVRNFLDCVRECLDAEVDYHHSTVTYRGRVTSLKAFPISVDYGKFEAMAAEPRTGTAMKEIRRKFNLRGATGIGVDRLEYTKALIKRLQALHLFFDRYERFRGRFTFIQIAVPTRMKEPYLSYKQTVEEYVRKINDRYGTPEWRPIVYIDTKVEHKDLVAYYRLADVAVISSIYDGMNLVAKEYVASQVDRRGALILSEFAGAADELDGAVLVNPYDVEEFSSLLRTALTMPQQERERRMERLREQVRDHDIYAWVSGVLKEIAAAAERKRSRSLYLFDHENEFRASLGPAGLYLFLDYDGTLAPIAETPDKAVLPHTVHSLVARLKERVPVAIVSGRGVDDVRQRMGLEGLVYAGNHGSEIWAEGGPLVSRMTPEARELLEELLGRLRASLAHIPGVLVEDKGATASVHYRSVGMRHLADFSDIVNRITREYESRFRISPGKKVVEIRPLGAWNKGDAVTWILDRLGPDRTAVYVGDDVTDEDAFRALKGRGISVSVGGSAHADYYLRRQDEVEPFLERMAEMLDAVAPRRG